MSPFTPKGKGFTLIELLIVIGIIGILAGIAFATIGGVRARAHDAEIRAEIGQIRLLAEMHHIERGAYTGFAVPVHIVAPVCSVNGYRLDITALSLAIFADLCAVEGRWWCVDTAGIVGEVTADPGVAPAPGDGRCPPLVAPAP